MTQASTNESMLVVGDWTRVLKRTSTRNSAAVNTVLVLKPARCHALSAVVIRSTLAPPIVPKLALGAPRYVQLPSPLADGAALGSKARNAGFRFGPLKSSKNNVVWAWTPAGQTAV